MKNEIKDLVFGVLILIAALFARDIPLKLQGLAGCIYGMLIMWSRIKDEENPKIDN